MSPYFFFSLSSLEMNKSLFNAMNKLDCRFAKGCLRPSRIEITLMRTNFSVSVSFY